MNNTENALSANVDIITKDNIKINGLSNINEILSTHYLVYKTINTYNGMYYIGQHQTNNPIDNYLGSGLLLTKDIELYSTSAFIKEILFDFDNKKQMNDKERELVPIISCNQFNKLCYNLAEGGEGGWLLDKTNEEKMLKWKNKRKETIDNWSAERKQQYHELRSAIAKRISSDPKSIAKRNKTLNNKTKEEKIETSEKHKNTLKNKPQKQKELEKQKWYDAINNRTKADKQRIHNNISNAAKNMDPIVKQAKINKITAKWKNKSKEEIQDIVDRRQKTINNKTDEEKQAYRRKKQLNQLGRKLMVKENTRKYIKPTEFDKYLKLGYKFQKT